MFLNLQAEVLLSQASDAGAWFLVQRVMRQVWPLWASTGLQLNIVLSSHHSLNNVDKPRRPDCFWRNWPGWKNNSSWNPCRVETSFPWVRKFLSWWLALYNVWHLPPSGDLNKQLFWINCHSKVSDSSLTLLYSYLFQLEQGFSINLKNHQTSSS